MLDDAIAHKNPGVEMAIENTNPYSPPASNNNSIAAETLGRGADRFDALSMYGLLFRTLCWQALLVAWIGNWLLLGTWPKRIPNVCCHVLGMIGAIWSLALWIQRPKHARTLEKERASIPAIHVLGVTLMMLVEGIGLTLLCVL